MCLDFVFNDTATTEIYTYCHTLSLHYALPILQRGERERYRQIRQTLTAWYPEVHELTMDVFIGGHFQDHIERTRKGYQRAELYQWAMLAVVAVLAVFLGAEVVRSARRTRDDAAASPAAAAANIARSASLDTMAHELRTP